MTHSPKMSILCAALVLTLGTVPVQAQTEAAPAKQNVAKAVPLPRATILVRSVISALDNANETGDYSVLSALGTREFQKTNPPETLTKTFASIRSHVLNPILILTPTYADQPIIGPQGVMQMRGHFDNGSERIRFQLQFQFESGRWRIRSFSLDIV